MVHGDLAKLVDTSFQWLPEAHRAGRLGRVRAVLSWAARASQPAHYRGARDDEKA
jgi:hypothetical protein